MSVSIDNLLKLNIQNPTYWEFQFNDEENSRFLIQDISLPFVSLETDTNTTGMRYFTGYTPEDEFSITFLETTDFKVLKYLEGWMNSIFDRENRVFRVGNKSKTGLLTFQKSVTYGASGITEASTIMESSRQYEFRNILLMDIEDKALDYQTTEAFTISATFIADQVVLVNSG